MAENPELEGVVREAMATYLKTVVKEFDPDLFEQPIILDLSRSNNPHLSFSHGIHYCLGAPLARLEGQIAISTLLQRFPKLALATDSITYCDNFVFRGLEELPVLLA